MEAARIYYETRGYIVTDTSLRRPYDYVASKPGDERRVEVKGAQGAGVSVIVTAGEVIAALDSPEPTDLFVLYGIEVIQRDDAVAAQGGLERVIVSWRPMSAYLVPTEYRYSLPVT